jgi:tetratricopeptide (TPR) repeat protein
LKAKAMRKTFFLFLVLITINGFSQGVDDPLPLPDSLAGRLREFRNADLSRAEALDAAIVFYYDNDRVLDAQGYVNELTMIAEELRDNYYYALSDYYQALVAVDKLDYDRSLEKLNDALERIGMLRKTDRTELLASKAYLALGSTYSHIDLLAESYDAYQRGLEKVGEDHPDVYLKLVNNLGDLYQHIEDIPEAEKAFKQALKLKKSLPYRNLATLLCERGSHDSALIYMDSAMMYSVSLKDSLCVKHLRGVLYLLKGDLDKAEEWYNECLYESQFCSDAFLNSVIYQNAAYIAMEKGDLEKALSLADTSIEIAQKLRIFSRRLECMRLKAIVLSEMRDYKKGLECMAEYAFKRDSVLMKQNMERFLNHVHQHETKEMEQRYEAERAIAKQRQGFVLVIAALVVLFSIVIMVVLGRNRRQKELLLKQELDLRNREVTSKSIGKIQSDETLNEVIKKLSEMETHPEKDMLPDIIRSLKSLVNDDARKDFDLHFVQVHPDFYKKLLAEYPRLTQNELRLCAFIKSNLSIKEIAAINGISVESVKTARKRLRKSLDLTGEDVSLLEFLSKY